MPTIEALVAALTLEPTAPDRYGAVNVPSAHGVVFGGQLVAQSIVAALEGHDDKTVKTAHTVFARSALPDTPVEILVEQTHSGRTFASATVTIAQGDRLCTKSLVLLHADEPDFMRHGAKPTRRSRPEDAAPLDTGPDTAWEVRVVDGVDVNDPDAVGPAHLDVWTRFVGAPSRSCNRQALVAFATDGFLIGAAMRPHAGVGQALAHQTVSTGVISHTITFHEPLVADEWVLLSHESPYAGHGRSYGSGEVFLPDGQLAVSFVQDAMIRPMPEGRRGSL